MRRSQGPQRILRPANAFFIAFSLLGALAFNLLPWPDLRLVPDLPAIAEMIPGFNNTTWYGILAPAGTPAAIVGKLNAELRNAVANPGFREKLETMGLDPISSTPEELRSRIRNELARWTKVIADAGVGLKQ